MKRPPSLIFFLLLFSLTARALRASDSGGGNGSCGWVPLVPMEERRTLVSTDYGAISAVDVDDGYRGPYHIQFVTMEPNSLFLPVLLRTHMLFYVHTGIGRVEWVVGDEEKAREAEIEQGDIFTLGSGSVFYMRSHPNPTTREKLRIYALFTNTDVSDHHPQVTPFGAYCSVSDLVLGFSKEVLQRTLTAPAELIEEMIGTTKPPSIIHMPSTEKVNSLDWKGDVSKILVENDLYVGSNGKKRMKPFNILRREPDVQNCNGQSLAVTAKDYHPLKRYDIGFFMVNLTKGSMMAPHWNPKATEIAMVLQGQGMVRIACSSGDGGENSRLIGVKAGDVFVVPRFCPMAHLSFNNDSLVFVGFSTMARRNHPQFLAGTRSVFQTIDSHILALSFNLTNSTMKRLLAPQENFVFLDCTSCAEEEEKRKQEREKKQKKKEEEEQAAARKKREEEEEEDRKKREEAEKERKKREEEEKKREEEKEERQKREVAEGGRRRKAEAAGISREREKKEEEAKRRAEQKRERGKKEAAAAAAGRKKGKEAKRQGVNTEQ